MTITKLVGSTLIACRFSRGSYSFEFSTQSTIFRLGTCYSISSSEAKMTAGCDAEKRISEEVWELLDKELLEIEHSEEQFAVRMRFAEGGELFVWSDEEPRDNLIVATDMQTGDWFTVG